MACACTEFNVSKCITTLRLGTITSLTTAVTVVSERVGDKRRFNTSLTTGGGGEVDLSIGEEFTPETSYKIWVSLDSNNDLEDKETLTFADTTTTDDCVLVNFKQAHDSSGLESLTTQYL